MDFKSPYPGLTPELIVSHFPYSGDEPVLVLELFENGLGPLWVPEFARLRPNARFIVFCRDEPSEQAARAATAAIADRVRFIRAEWFSGVWETKLPGGFHVIWAPFVADSATADMPLLLIGRLSAKLREGGMLFWGTELAASSKELEADYVRRLGEYRKGASLNPPPSGPDRQKGKNPRMGAEQIRKCLEAVSLSNVDLLWKQELASVTVGMRKA